MKTPYRNINLIQRGIKAKTAQAKWTKSLRKTGGITRKLRRGN
jgi:hypothetical protein